MMRRACELVRQALIHNGERNQRAGRAQNEVPQSRPEVFCNRIADEGGSDWPTSKMTPLTPVIDMPVQKLPFCE